VCISRRILCRVGPHIYLEYCVLCVSPEGRSGGPAGVPVAAPDCGGPDNHVDAQPAYERMLRGEGGGYRQEVCAKQCCALLFSVL